GLTLEVDRGNVVRRVAAGSAAARAGLEPGGGLRLLAGGATHPIADTQLAPGRAPAQGKPSPTWDRGGEGRQGTLAPAAGWRNSDITWRPSMRALVPRLPLYGSELTEAEKKLLGLPPRPLAFRQRSPVNSRAEAAGVRDGDVILGVDGKTVLGKEAED